MSARATKRLKFLVHLRAERGDVSDQERPFIGLEHIESGTGRLLGHVDVEGRSNADAEGEAAPIGEVSNSFEPGDVLFGKLRPYLAKAWVATFPGRCTTEILVMQPTRISALFLKQVVLSRDFIDPVDASTFGSKMPRADWDFIGNMPIPCPGLEEQEIIAAYLDRETARIDALVAAKEGLLAILDEKRRALITTAVTRGLDPAAPLRDCGVPWLGKIPAKWQMKRAKWLFTERDERSVDGSEVLLSLRMERGLVPHNDVSEKQTSPAELIGYKKVSAGELVINRMRASLGLIAVAPEDGLVSPDYAVFRPSEGIHLGFFLHLFQTDVMRSVFRSESTGLGTGSSGFLRLYSENFLALWLPCPHFNEQAAIAAHISTETSRMEALRAETERTIALLKERRAALISATVTGRMKVR